MALLELLRLFQPHNAPELCYVGVVDGSGGVHYVAVLTANDYQGNRVGVEVGFAVLGAPAAAWLRDANDTLLWQPGQGDVAYDDAVAGIVTAALAAHLGATRAPLVERAIALAYSPESLDS